MKQSACSAVICQPGGCEQKHDTTIMMSNNFRHFRFLSCNSKVKASSAQKGLTTAQHHKRYCKYAKKHSVD